MIKSAFRKYPLLMNSLFYGTLYSAAEFTQQTIQKKVLRSSEDTDYKWGKILNFVEIGLFPIGPSVTICFAMNILFNKYFCTGMQHQGKPKSYDPYNITRYGILGVTIFPPIYFYWYRWLDKKYPQITMKVILKKLLLDQFVCTPVVLTMFFVGMAILESQPDILQDWKTNMIPTFGKSCLFWLPAQTVNFLLVPPTLRVVYIATCAFFWANILCIVKRQEATQKSAHYTPSTIENK